MKKIMYEVEKEYIIKAKGKSDEEVTGKIFTELKHKVTSDTDGIVIRLEPVNVYEISRNENEYTETFLFFFMPRQRKNIELEYKVVVNIKYIK